ncbi:MAG: DUF58 domain-containing protein [Luteolibacter sp.]
MTQELPGSPMRRALATAKESASQGSTLPPPIPKNYFGPSQTPPPLPTKTIPTLAESATAAREKLTNARAEALLDQSELSRFKSLIIFAKTLVDSRFQGRHKSPDLGGGGEFSEYLAYEPGRPVQDIDWHVFARSRKLVIRRYRQETDMDIHLLVDASGSMAYRGGDREEKGLSASRIAAALSYLMHNQGDKTSLTLFADRILDHHPSGGTRRHLLTLLRSLVKPAHEATGKTDLLASIAECERLIKRRGRLILISDLLGHTPNEIFEALSPFVHRGFEILIMQVTDPDEITLPDAPLARFVDMETGETVQVEPSEIRHEYEQHIRAKTRELSRNAARHRIDFISLNTASPYREAIEAYLGFRKK